MEQHHHSSPSFINIAVLLLFAVVIAVASTVTTYFILNSRSNEQYSTSQSSVVPQPRLDRGQPQTNVLPTSTPITELQTIPDETANWKVYRNEENGYEIKYPNSWTKQVRPTIDPDIVYLHANESFGEGPEPIQYFVWITMEDKLPDVKFTEENFGKYVVYKTDELPSRSGALSAFISEDNKKYIQLSITPYDLKEPFPSQSKYVNIFNQILSTFKFLK